VHRLISAHDAADAVVFNTAIIVTDRLVLDRQLQETVAQFDGGAGKKDRRHVTPAAGGN
jgi:type I restriction enzyme R subunit